MIGNMWEWVADWMQSNTGTDAGWQSTADYNSDAIFGINEAYPYEHRLPAALMRGGGYNSGDPTWNGAFALSAVYAPSGSHNAIGFRCGK
jgi:formylglycine-generating enzyme required for sulfatase activity